MENKTPPPGYIDTDEIRRRFPRFKTRHFHPWMKSGHPAIKGRLKRKPVPGRKREFFYYLKQLQQIDAYWDRAEQSENPPEVRDADGTICLRIDLVPDQYPLCLHDLYTWSRQHCPALDESQNPVRGHRTPHRLRPVRPWRFYKWSKRRYRAIYFPRNQLEQIVRNRSAWKRYKDEGWLFCYEVGKNQGIPPNLFRSWRRHGFPKGAPKLEIRQVLCPKPDGRWGWRVMCAPDSIKELADWYNAAPSADKEYSGEDGAVYRKASFLVRQHTQRTGKPPRRSGKTGRPPVRALTETLLQRWRETGCDELDGEILDARLVKMRLSNGRISYVSVYNVDQVKRMVAARQGQYKPPTDPRTPQPADAGTDAQIPAKELPPVFSRHDGRDKWIYEQAINGREWDLIRIHLTKHEEWEPINTINGIKRAAHRYAKRHGKPLPPRRKAGRPAGK